MSFGLSKGRDLDATTIEVPTSTFPPLPDDVLSRPEPISISSGREGSVNQEVRGRCWGLRRQIQTS